MCEEFQTKITQLFEEFVNTKRWLGVLHVFYTLRVHGVARCLVVLIFALLLQLLLLLLLLLIMLPLLLSVMLLCCHLCKTNC